MQAPEPPLRAPHPIFQGGVTHPDREEEGDDGGVALVGRRMQRGPAALQGRGRTGQEEERRREGGRTGGRGCAWGAAGERRGRTGGVEC